MKKIFTLIIGICSIAGLQAQSTVVGTTTYDLQTNGGNKSRLLVHDDGTVSAMWTGSTSGTISFTDRGMFFNSSPDGTTWGAFPTTRIEPTRTGFGDMVKVGAHEVMFSHDGTNIYVFKNDELGGTSWTPTAGSLQITGLWPNAYCPEGTDDIYVVNANSSTPTGVYFSKSTDGGESWDILEYTLPYLTTDEGFGAIGGEAYQIAVYGSDVYVLYGANYADLVLLHSDAGGADGTWTSEIIWDSPLENYTAAAGQTTDYDADGDFDTILTTDGNYDMLMTDDGTLHVFAGTMYILDNNIAAGYSYFPTVGGILYWKTGVTGMYYLDVVIDWKNDDGLDDPYAGIGQSFASYGGESFTTLPSSAYDPASGRIYLTYTMPVEYTDQLGDPTAAAAESKNDLFGIYSDDNGDSWTFPVNLTYTAFAGQENYFPMVYDRVVDGKIHVLWQQDDNPGTAVDAAPADAIHTNNLRYAVWDETRFQPYAPNVAFSYTLTPAGPSFDAVFTNLSADAETYFWDFGDGFTSTLTNPTHTYAEGVYDVCLTGFNVYGEATVCETIIAVFPPTALFDYSGDPTVDFTDLSTNEPTSWAWDFDDGGTSALQNPTHTFALNGIYNVCLTASNVGGASTYCENVVISTYAAPLANFSFAGDPTVTFTDLTIGDPTSWDWTFDDGDVSTEQNPVHTYATNGTYNVCLTATNALGTSTSCQDVTIGSYLPPVALFTFSGDPLVTFTDLSTESPSLWSWDFGDGEFSTEQNPVHNYTENGTYTVCLTATNDIGSGSSCQTVVIDFYPLPEAIFTFTGDPTVSFTDLSTNSPDSWFWNFDDGGFSSEQNPVHTFTTNDTYNVCLEVTNAGGVDVVCQDVVIGNVVTIPVADFDYFFGVDLSVSFFDNSTNSPASWAWTFGDGETSDLQDPVHVYAAPGSYNVCLTAGNAGGSDEYCQQITLTGIETNNAVSLTAYPNPASATITIEMPQIQSDVTVQVINAIGQKIAIEPIMNGNNSSISLNIESLPAGAYTVAINAKSIKYIATFIKE
jgi:PKD repeat protein